MATSERAFKAFPAKKLFVKNRTRVRCEMQEAWVHLSVELRYSSRLCMRVLRRRFLSSTLSTAQNLSRHEKSSCGLGSNLSSLPPPNACSSSSSVRIIGFLSWRMCDKFISFRTLHPSSFHLSQRGEKGRARDRAEGSVEHIRNKKHFPDMERMALSWANNTGKEKGIPKETTAPKKQRIEEQHTHNKLLRRLY